MKPQIIFLNVSDEKIKKLKPVLGLMGIRITVIDSSRLNDTVGHIAYPDMFENDSADGKTQEFNDEFMLICGMDGKMLDTVLNFMRGAKQSIALKAMLTETNSLWSLSRLISEISAERMMIAAQRQNKNKN